ncbi:hypothetical protein [Alicyclobacillus fodiniaquatilis]|uniref:Uncharacterized protein n=1 Tax=Alicyclobacillus fodiniaquatilis TaxID=1661150 RepID=A0ABW4JEN7_9BACL
MTTWTVREHLTGDLDEDFTSLDVARQVAKALSKHIYQLIEVVDTETHEVVLMYVDGKEYLENKPVQLGFDIGLPEDTAKQLGRSIWEDLESRNRLVRKLRKQLSLSVHEQKQLDVTELAVAERLEQLSSVLTETEYKCCYYKYFQYGDPNVELNYCDRQIRRYVGQALKKTGQTAHIEKWKTLGIKSVTDIRANEFVELDEENQVSITPM